MMAKVNSQRHGCRDVFHSEILRQLKYEGEYDIPIIREEHIVPRKMIPFSKAMAEKRDFNQWVCFYEDDYLFERVWNSPKRYVRQLSRFEGVISPDFSVYYDMPLAMQMWNIFRNRALGAWLQKQGIKVIPNIRFGDGRTFECSCAGVSRYSVISIGTLGCLKANNYRDTFEKGVEFVATTLKPETIIFYGAFPKNIDDIKDKGINVVTIKPQNFHLQKEVEE